MGHISYFTMDSMVHCKGVPLDYELDNTLLAGPVKDGCSWRR